MEKTKTIKERRRFLKYVFGMGTTLWLTPIITTVSAKKGHACLSGRGGKGGGRDWDGWDGWDGWNGWDGWDCGKGGKGGKGGRGGRGW